MSLETLDVIHGFYNSNRKWSFMMKKLTKVLIAGLALLGTALQSATVQHFLAGVVGPLAVKYPGVASALVAIAAILALVHNPQDPQKTQ
jgi:hypothetical protein